VTSEAIRTGCGTFGQPYANALRHRRRRPGDTRHLDEVFLTITVRRHHLWHAVDRDGHMLDIVVQRRRDRHAAKPFCRKILRTLSSGLRVTVTDQLNRDGAAMRERLLEESTARTAIWIPVRSTRTIPPATASGGRQGSSRQGRPTGSWPRMGRSRSPSGPGRHLVPPRVSCQDMPQRLHTRQNLRSVQTTALRA
jgi:hypothetical protein